MYIDMENELENRLWALCANVNMELQIVKRKKAIVMDKATPNMTTLAGVTVSCVEPNVYEVTDKKSFINVDSLKQELKKCILITSLARKREKNPETGRNTILAKVYFIITDYDAEASMNSYHMKALRTIDDESVVDSYFERPEMADSVDTVYSAEELGRAGVI